MNGVYSTYGTAIPSTKPPFTSRHSCTKDDCCFDRHRRRRHHHNTRRPHTTRTRLFCCCIHSLTCSSGGLARPNPVLLEVCLFCLVVVAPFDPAQVSQRQQFKKEVRSFVLDKNTGEEMPPIQAPSRLLETVKKDELFPARCSFFVPSPPCCCARPRTCGGQELDVIFVVPCLAVASLRW